MKTGSAIVALSIMLILAFTGCITTVVRPANGVIGTEDAAVAKLGDDIYSLRLFLRDKKIGIVYFTTLDWQILDAGRRISGKLADYLARKGGLVIIPRTELDAKMKTQAIEKATMFDVEAIQKSRKSLPADVMVYGIVMQDMGTVRIELKVVDIATGRIILLSGVRMPSSGEFSSLEKPEMLELYKKSPDKITDINKTFFLLQWMKINQPLVFLLVVIENSEMKTVHVTNKVLYGKLEKRKERYQHERPDVIKKITALRDGLSLIKRYDQQRFGEIIRLKKELLARMK
jgi:hypothetical protein